MFYETSFFGNIITGNLNDVERYVIKEQWGKAEETHNKVEENWRKFRFIVLFNYGAEEYLTLYNNLD